MVSVLRAYEQALNLDIAKLVECRRASQSRDSYNFGEGLASRLGEPFTLLLDPSRHLKLEILVSQNLARLGRGWTVKCCRLKSGEKK